MALTTLARHVRDAWEVPRDLVLGRYPEFVTGGALPRGDIPVFVFHSLEPDSFARKLRHLSDNGYRSLSADEYYLVLIGARPAPDKAVVLTFDDGRASVWSVGYPLMNRYGMKGIVFLVPGRTSEAPAGPTLDDVRAGRLTLDSLLARDGGPEPFVSWEEVQRLARSGLFDFQSHTLLHARVHCGPRVVGFMTPRQRQGYARMDVPLVEGRDGDLLAQDVPLGTPLLESAPRTSEAFRYREDARGREACVRAVAEGGGEAFFRQPGWERALWRLAGRSAPSGRPESTEARRDAILRELAEARRIIEERTGAQVMHLCYPWHAAGPTARGLAREAGYRTAFCGKVPGVPVTRPGGDLESIARIGEDYLELLPGDGRATLRAVLRRKWARRRKGAS